MNPVALHWTARATKTIAWVLAVSFLVFVWINPYGATAFASHHVSRILGGANDGLVDTGAACPDTTFPVIGPCAGQPGPDVAADVRNSDGVAAP